MFYAGFDMLFSILFPILFLVVLGMILYTIIGNISTWNKNNHSPRLTDRKSTRLNSSHIPLSRMPSSA